MQVDSKLSPLPVTGTPEFKTLVLPEGAEFLNQTGPGRKGLFISRSGTEEKLGFPWVSPPLDSPLRKIII